MDRKVTTCLGCKYYYVTWDKNASKGCRYFGFKTFKMPCDIVFESTGSECTMYIARVKE